MSKKGGNFFEEHIDKVILVIVGALCLWILLTRVVISPNVVSYDNRKFSSGDIDRYISGQIASLEDKLDRKPEPKKPYEPNVGRYTELVDSAIRDIDVSFYLPQPGISSSLINDKRFYDLPSIGGANEVSVEYMRAVAYVPTEEISEENFYSENNSEPNDIDFVTVEAEFDITELYDSFYSSFAGEEVKREWRDPCLAEPIFAAVQLQRQQLLADGSWSDWEIVPRTKIDFRKEMFEVVETVDKLPAGGMKVRLLQFDNVQVMIDVLQPEMYQIASEEAEWFPPSLHKKFLEISENIEAQEKRDARAAEKKEREQLRESRRKTTTTQRPTRIPSTGVSGARRIDTGKERPEKVREIPKPESISDVYDEFNKILITSKTVFKVMSEPLLFWAHDDTIEPDKSYRYRIRLGVFNPIAGTNKFSEQYKPMKDKVILWSVFSDTTDVVDVPSRLYFFPFEMQEAAKIVTVRIYRYVLGYWYSKDFTVRQGETIGGVVESLDKAIENKIIIPESIDYSTGAVLVDVVSVDDWSGGKKLRARRYFDMLYSFDGMNIKRMPIKTRYWPEEMQVIFGEIRKAEKEPKEPLRAWSSKGVRTRRSVSTGGRGATSEEGAVAEEPN